MPPRGKNFKQKESKPKKKQPKQQKEQWNLDPKEKAGVPLPIITEKKRYSESCSLLTHLGPSQILNAQHRLRQRIP